MPLPFQGGQGNSISDGGSTAANKNTQDFGGAHIVYGNDYSQPPLAPPATGTTSVAMVGGLLAVGVVFILILAKRKK